MPTFQIRGRDGGLFEVEAPNAEAAIAAFRQFQPEPAGIVEDVAKSAGVGLAEGIIGLAGLPGDIREAALSGAKFLAERLGVDEETAEERLGLARGALRVVPGLGGPTSEEIQRPIVAVTGEFREPETTAGEFARTIGQFAPGALLPGSAAVRAGQVLAPAVASETAGQLTEGTPFEAPARIGGAIVGGAGVAGARRAITPNPARSPQVTADVAALEREGVTSITAGQRTANPRLVKQESLSEFSAAAETLELGKEQFTRAVLRRAGINADRATPDVVDNAFNTVGKAFDDLQTRNSAIVTPELRQSVSQTVRRFTDEVPENAVPRVVKNLPDRLTRTERLTGTEYKELRSSVARVARSSEVPEVSRSLQKIARELDDAMEATIARENPGDLGAFRETRRQFANMMVIAKAAQGGGREAAQGIISPARLRQAAVNVEGGRRFVRNQSEFAQLARSGTSVMTPPPTSGTPEGIRALGGRGLLGIPSDVLRMGRTSRLGQQFLSNQVAPPSVLGGVSGPTRGLVGGALAIPQNR